MIEGKRCSSAALLFLVAAVVVAFAVSGVAGGPARIDWSVPFGTQMARMSFAAYCNPSAVANWSCKYCTDPITVVATPSVASDATFAFVGYDSSNSTVSIRNHPNFMGPFIRF